MGDMGRYIISMLNLVLFFCGSTYQISFGAENIDSSQHASVIYSNVEYHLRQGGVIGEGETLEDLFSRDDIQFYLGNSFPNSNKPLESLIESLLTEQ